MAVKWKRKDVDKLARKGMVGELPVPLSAKGNKYGNTVVEKDGKKFGSKKEANRYPDLVLMQLAGEIRDLKCQQKFDFVINEILVCSYIADFTYIIVKTNAFTVEDVKSEVTRKNREYNIKRKLMLAVYKIKILET